MVELEAKILRLDDLEQIRDLARRYAHYVWQGQVLKAVELFSSDGCVDLGADDGGLIQGKEQLKATYFDKVGSDQMMLHPFVHNHIVDLNGDQATGTAYLDLRCTKQGQSLMGSGYYLDDYIREQGQWKFKRRKLTMCYLVPPGQDWI